jgi:hypothetical protein
MRQRDCRNKAFLFRLFQHLGWGGAQGLRDTYPSHREGAVIADAPLLAARRMT